MAASKKRGNKSHSAKPRGRHVSGNPATRSADDRRRQNPAPLHAAILESRRWWDASAADVLARAHHLESADSLLALENAACTLLGEELVRRLENEQGGFDLPEWLNTVADHAATDLHETPAPGPRLLLHALVAFGTDHAARTAKIHLDKLKQSPAATEFALRYPWIANSTAARPAGEPLITTDAYGSRYLLVAPFQTGDDPIHWYAWDSDLCDTQLTVAAGVFADPQAALAEWMTAVGPEPTAHSHLSPATDPVVIRDLLAECLLRGPAGSSIIGAETPDLLAEHFRMRTRAQHLDQSLPGHESKLSTSLLWETDAESRIHETVTAFADWFETRHPTTPFNRSAAVDLIAEWLSTGPRHTHFTCSPHRIRALTTYLWDLFADESASAMCGLLPSWVTWCAEQTNLTPALTARSLAEAHRSTTVTRATLHIEGSTPLRVAE